MSKSRKNRSLQSRPTIPGKDASDAPAREAEAGQTEIRSIVLQELSVARSDFFSGPLPHPDHLKEYENILPGSADRLIRIVEEEAPHRRQIDVMITNSNTKLEARGQVFGFIIAMTALIGGGYLIESGQSVWGISVPIAAIAGLSGLFVWKARKRKREPDGQTGVAIPGPAPPKPPRETEQ